MMQAVERKRARAFRTLGLVIQAGVIAGMGGDGSLDPLNELLAQFDAVISPNDDHG